MHVCVCVCVEGGRENDGVSMEGRRVLGVGNRINCVCDYLADVKDILMDYFTLFGAKTCMFDDLCLFLDVFDKIDREVLLRFVQHLQQVVNSEPVDFLCPDEDLKKNVSHFLKKATLEPLR